MRSLARRHFERTMAARQSAAVAHVPTADRSAYSAMLTTLGMQKVALKAIKSIKAKIEAKRDFLPEYADYVAGVLESGAGVQDDVVMTVMVWRLDVGLFAEALDIAAYALRHQLAMPDGFNRDAACAVVEEIADAANADPSEDIAGFVGQALDLTLDADMPDEVRAKANKALGMAAKDTDPAAALAHLKAALDFDPKCGVKTELGRLEKKIAAQAESS